MGYKLTYWNVKGKAEPIRLIFATANIPFEDNRISKKDWLTLKQSMPWGQVPVLEFEGKVLAQSVTICRYLAKKYNLAGSTELEAAKCDEYVDVLQDILLEMKKIAHSKAEVDKVQAKKEFLENNLPKCFNKFEKILQSQDGAFLINGKLTWADIVVVDLLEKLEGDNYAGPSLLKDYPNLKMLKLGVHFYPGIKEWIEKRPKDI